jgi:chromosome partitioning protein
VDSDLVGIAEVARMARVTRAAVSNWRARFPDFPKPVAELQAGPVFDHGQIRAWLRRRRVPMATVISMINLKGGVGKTTTTVALAEFMDVEYGKRVLVIDLDPQTNATVMLIGDRRWGRLNADKQTIAQLFEDALDPGHHIFDLQASIQRGVGAVEDVTRVSLLPSSIDLIDVQERVLTLNPGRFHAANPIDILRRAIKPVLDEFDVVLVDCPPSMGVVTLNGLRISQGYVIPVIPDVLSTYGIPQIVRRVHDFSEAIQEEIAPLGIVISKYRVQSTVHKNQVELLRAEKDAPVFKTTIPEMNDVAGAAEFKAVSTLRQKWGYKGIYEAYHALAGEILEKASVPE